MSPGRKENVGHSIFQRLLNHAKAHKEDFNHVLLRYGVERLLYRLSLSGHADRFVLKGASLFLVWKGQNYRVTKDVDLLCLGPSDAPPLADLFKEGMANSRMKDFYDVWLLKELFAFDGQILCEALKGTFQRRSTAFPRQIPIALTEEFHRDAQKQTQWRAFVRKARPKGVPGIFKTVIDDLAAFLMPVVKAAQTDRLFERSWPQGGPWRDRKTEDRGPSGSDPNIRPPGSNPNIVK